MRKLIVSASLLLCADGAALAQSWRTFDVTRQARDSAPLAVHVMFGAGRMVLRPDSDRNLYDVHLRYDIDAAEPVYRYDAKARTLDVGVRHISKVRTARGGDGGELQVELSRDVALKLDLDIGAAESQLDLGGLRVEDFALKTGATDTKVRFNTPNPIRLRSARIDAGAANVEMFELGNANVERIAVNMGVGHVTLDFGGAWRGNTEVELNSALGGIDLAVPSDVGVRVQTSTFLYKFSGSGMVKRNGAWESENYATARYKLNVRSSGALGSLEVKWIAR